jgi:Icc-related predicted phosphoesterase
VIISDTHGIHEELDSLSGDVLIHCGDFCDGFRVDEDDLVKLDRWFAGLDFDRILCIGGNHDFVAQERRSLGKPVFEHAIYLEDEGHEFGGLKFYGSPWLPDLAGWAYYLSDQERRAKWALIPSDTDILITHTPPFGILDKPRSGRPVGCSYLRTVLDDLDLRFHCFGHVHASYGQSVDSQIPFYNASLVDSDYKLTNAPIIVDL